MKSRTTFEQLDYENQNVPYRSNDLFLPIKINAQKQIQTFEVALKSSSNNYIYKIMLNCTRFLSSSTSTTLTWTCWCSFTTSFTSLTKPALSWEICTRPLSLTPMSTKHPKLVMLFTIDFLQSYQFLNSLFWENMILRTYIVMKSFFIGL